MNFLENAPSFFLGVACTVAWLGPAIFFLMALSHSFRCEAQRQAQEIARQRAELARLRSRAKAGAPAWLGLDPQFSRFLAKRTQTIRHAR